MGVHKDHLKKRGKKTFRLDSHIIIIIYHRELDRALTRTPSSIELSG
jgi:hypothetical protein